MPTLLTFHHGYAEITEMTPTCFPIPLILPLSGKLVSILASTVSTSPVDDPRLSTNVPWITFLSSELGGDLSFQKLLYDELHCRSSGGFCLFLHRLPPFLALFTLYLALRKEETPMVEAPCGWGDWFCGSPGEHTDRRALSKQDDCVSGERKASADLLKMVRAPLPVAVQHI